MKIRNSMFEGKTISVLIIMLLTMSIQCSTIQQDIDTSSENPHKPQVTINDGKIIISNNAIKASWILIDKSIVLSELENKLDGDVVDMKEVILFAIELADGKRLTNLDFKLQGELNRTIIQVSDSLPTRALHYSGKEISGLFVNDNISIKWTAQLRDSSNYIRQNIEVRALRKAETVVKVIFFDGELDGAQYAGSVLGSPIDYHNFFFGMEHPIAQSKALFSRTIGRVGQDVINISEVVKASGDYIIAIEHGGGSDDYNVESISILENNIVISQDEHQLNGAGGTNFYQVNIANYQAKNTYSIRAGYRNKDKATGTFHIYKKIDNLLNFYVVREDELQPGSTISEWAVIGVAPKNQKRRAFLTYLERERARPYKQFLHYNCWWDITDDGASSFTSEQLIGRMNAWNEKFIQPYDIQLNSFVFDDGWDNLDSVWFFDPVKFPNGFTPQAELCKEFNSGIGVWMSPFGGYLENKRRRIESAHREGLETNDKGLSLAGKNYYNRFLERSLDMLNNYNVNYFKYDGFGGSEPKYLPDMEAGTQLISSLRQHNPDVFINITVGSWPSPFWLKYADCTWRGSGDLHNAGVGNKTQKFMTYRDGTLFNNIVKRAPYYPLNSIMVVGVAYANLGHPANYINDNLDDFKDMVRSFFAGGSSLQELYISHDRMREDFWPILAEATVWAKENEDVLHDVHWIGGSPINLEVYGFASWIPGKGTISFRNPSGDDVTYELNLRKDLELPGEVSGDFILKSPWRENVADPVLNTSADEPITIRLSPFETKVFSIIQLQ